MNQKNLHTTSGSQPEQTPPNRKKKKSAAQKKKATIQKALILMGMICALGTIILIVLPQPINEVANNEQPEDVTAPETAPKTPLEPHADMERPQAASQQTAPQKEPAPVPQQRPDKKPVPQHSVPDSVIPQHKPVQPPASYTPAPQQPAPTEHQKPTEYQKPAAHKGTLVFVFDDAGHNMEQLKPFLDLPFPVTIAVLPGLPKSREVAQAVRAAGKELMLHQPMQAINRNIDPGPGSLQPGMTFSQITDILLNNTAQIEGLSGINNHEGSLITQDETAMRAVLEFCRDRGLYFLDSRTTASSVVREQAELLNMTIWERAVFLDNTPDTQDIIAAVQSGMNIAEKKGNAVMIGHIWSNTLAQTLQELYPELEEQGFSMSTIAHIAGYGE